MRRAKTWMAVFQLIAFLVRLLLPIWRFEQDFEARNASRTETNEPLKSEVSHVEKGTKSLNQSGFTHPSTPHS